MAAPPLASGSGAATFRNRIIAWRTGSACVCPRARTSSVPSSAGSRVRNPFERSTPWRRSSSFVSARAMPSWSAPACPATPPPSHGGDDVVLPERVGDLEGLPDLHHENFASEVVDELLAVHQGLSRPRLKIDTGNSFLTPADGRYLSLLFHKSIPHKTSRARCAPPGRALRGTH